MKLVVQIGPHLTSWQYPLLNHLDNFQDVESNSDFKENKQIDFQENKESYLEENQKVYFEDKDLKGIDPELEFVKELTDFTEFDQESGGSLQLQKRIVIYYVKKFVK